MNAFNEGIWDAAEAEAPSKEGRIGPHVRDCGGRGGHDLVDGMAVGGGGEGMSDDKGSLIRSLVVRTCRI